MYDNSDYVAYVTVYRLKLGADSENEAIVSNVYQQGDSVCIECYFTDKNDSCVVIVHQNISQLNLTKESLNISLIHLINRTNDSEKGHLCIPGINLYEYQVGVIPLILNLKQKSLRTEGIWTSIVKYMYYHTVRIFLSL